MNKKLLWIGITLVFVGVVLVATTVYQEKVGEPQWPEDYHMVPQPTVKYEWRSRNMAVTTLGTGFIVFGLGFIGAALIHYGRGTSENDRTQR